MGTDETYQGWANRETWALCLWLNNDQGSYNEALDIAEAALTVADIDPADQQDKAQARVIGEALREWVESLCADVIDAPEMRSRELLMMLLEVGSLWRVEWDEVGAAFLPSEHGR